MKKISNFIVLEGSHGSGKTTQAHLLDNYLSTKGFNSIYSKEPFLAELIPIIEKFSHIENNISANLLLFLHAADRYMHVNFIKEKIKNGSIVISDRYLLSSLVYQRIQGISISLIEKLNFFCVIPQITFIFNIPLNERKNRVKKSSRFRDSIFFTDNNLSLESQFYDEIYREYKSKWNNVYLINSIEDINKTFSRIKKIINNIIPL